MGRGLQQLTHFSLCYYSFTTMESEFLDSVLQQTPSLTHLAITPLFDVGFNKALEFAQQLLLSDPQSSKIRLFLVVLPSHLDIGPQPQWLVDPRLVMLSADPKGEILGVDFDWSYPRPNQPDAWEMAESILAHRREK